MSDGGSEVQERGPQVVIAGFGLPGRVVAELLDAQRIRYSIIELNPQVVARIGEGRRIVAGDIRDEGLLRSAGIVEAQLLVIGVPDDKAMLECIAVARRINPSLRIMARCAFTSIGMRAQAAGADMVVVAEQVIAREMARLAEGQIATLRLEGNG